ncbi:MAG: circularly permuted type 2 ATP-grasp protein, partial [Verrucomicrobia bacterium]|nr:circularly permuted type 2 ATP-grasp protein [Verrucomicrobiota bacterium]
MTPASPLVLSPDAVASAGYDESLGSSGGTHPSWASLQSSLARLGPEEMSARAEGCRRLLSDHGVTCFVPRDGGGTDEPWQLDLLPLLLSADEWSEIEAGLKQRARLLALILDDLYGFQRLVRDGFVPAPLVFANPAFLRPCQGLAMPGKVRLHSYAADLARTADGRWRVIADRTQAPTGLGFALENRSTLSRVLPEAVRQLQPRALSDVLRRHRENLRRFAPEAPENPVIALLTPGPRHEAYFEHAYLARLLGLTLVEGDDLTVRDRRVFIKTLDGLRAVDVIVRRVNDAYCDPLELRGDSLLGVPGLLEVTRAGCVAVANSLGSGLLESPAFLPLLPALCRHLLQEELLLPSIDTWWCGQGAEQAHVRDHLDSLVLRPAFGGSGPVWRTQELAAGHRALLAEDLRLRPHEFVGQAEILPSRTPCWSASGGDSRPVTWRAIVLHDGYDFQVVPGGLARVLEAGTLATGHLPLSGLSKDVWVLPDRAATLPPIQVFTAPQPALERAPSDLPSRTADNFFWLGRYTERLEQLARVLRYFIRHLSEEPGASGHGRLESLGRALARPGLLPDTVVAEADRPPLAAVVSQLVFAEGHTAGVRDLLGRIHLAAFSVRDRLSADTWRILNRLEPEARPGAGNLPLLQAGATLQTLLLNLSALAGLETENMPRGHGWLFLDLGRRLERGLFLSQLLEAVMRSGPDLERLLEPALEISDSVMTHRRRYFAEPRLAGVLEVLVHDASNPRAL